ncbi:putative glutamate--cysteine ligase 2 [Nocardiopsis terrae]|uniref:Putative glutamate--cysteine ligase 2 n=1 Tax=Nocardiopsis terrae TaxID=372655 RepID=A0ABR9HNM8_9ACTN|nr:glutamate--cysteine ligase [Nocardiopsis terrae]MBE1460627.1 carboxylate-amine ligase [Nocardiopsis terrae]GHC72515.1 putative glutamate--cysteine ligase 2 [Nocardiopsis terrae]
MENCSLTADESTVPVGTANRPLTFGVEEEFFVVDPRTRRILSRAPDVLARTRVLGAHLCGEFTGAQVEANSPVCTTAEDARAFLESARGELRRAAGDAGLAVAATGTAVLGDPGAAAVSKGRRYADIAAYFGALRDAHVVCGCHVHVGIPDRSTAVAVSDHLRRWLPFLVALSANSPFQSGRDTGHASWRTVSWNRLPSAGPPPLLRTLTGHERAVRGLAASGAILDRHMVYWDIRLSDHLPTLEVRVGDVAATAEEALLFATLTRGLAARALADVRHGVPAPELSGQTLRAAVWRAARDGLEGVVPDPLTGEALTASAAMERIRRAALPGLALTGDTDLVSSLLDRVLTAGSGAARQRSAYARRERMSDVVDHLVAQTGEGLR